MVPRCVPRVGFQLVVAWRLRVCPASAPCSSSRPHPWALGAHPRGALCFFMFYWGVRQFLHHACSTFMAVLMATGGGVVVLVCG